MIPSRVELGNKSYQIVRIEQTPAQMSRERLSEIIDHLHSLSDNISLAAFGNAYGQVRPGTGVILLCGFMERFRATSILRYLDFNCLVVQDVQAPWYTGSSGCPNIDDISSLAQGIFVTVRRWILVGQSSGGYAALALSRQIPECITIALAPQSFDDGEIKGNKLQVPPMFHVSRTLKGAGTIRDLRASFFERPCASNAHVFIIAAFSEHENPPTHWLWIDAMHWGRLIDHPDVTVFLTTGTVHPVLLGKVDEFAKLLLWLAVDASWEADRIVSQIRHVIYT